ncbi:MAG: hypothetical protein ACR2NM_09235 [Bythopirellula sp.]
MRVLTLVLFSTLTLARPAPADAQTVLDTIGGNDYLVQVLRTLEHHASIAAKVRNESHLHDQTLTGSGNYWQLRTQGKRLTRWELQTQIADQTASFVQVYDGIHLWTDRSLPSRRQVNRLDVAWLQSRLRASNRGRELDQRHQLVQALQGQGGLGQMLGELLGNFDFQPPQSTQLNGLPVNALVGQWRPEQLRRLWPEAELSRAGTAEWPEQLPHHVLLLVGRNNLFPYVCEHRSGADAALATNLSGLRPTNLPLLRYEIFEVQTAVAISQETFQYVPGDIEWTDETALVLTQLMEQEHEPELRATAVSTTQSTQQ